MLGRVPDRRLILGRQPLADRTPSRESGAARRVEALLDDQTLPANLDAERALLGSMVLNNDLFEEARETLLPEDFSYSPHQRIFRAMEDLRLQGRPFDLVALTEWLHQRGELEASGGAAYLAEIPSGIPSLTTVSHYVEILKGRSVLRQLIRKASGIIAEAYSSSDEPQMVLARAEQGILEIGDQTLRSTLQPMSELAGAGTLKLEALIKRGEHVTGVATHFKRLDELTSGLQPSDYILVAARPSVGKTAFALSMALGIARAGGKVAFFSLEMSAEQIFFRFLSMISGVDLYRLRTGRLTRANQAEVALKIDELARLPIFVDDSSAQSVLDIGAKLRRLRTGTGLDVAFIDYLGLMHGVGKFESRNLEVASISRGLKALAKDLNVPVVALSQLSRAPEKRGEGKDPILSDLRDSGSLEQDADMVLFLHRSILPKDEDPDAVGRAKLIIAKQRNGPTDTLDLTFLPWRVQFADPAAEAFEG
jgi:replicative DNA helicase